MTADVYPARAWHVPDPDCFRSTRYAAAAPADLRERAILLIVPLASGVFVTIVVRWMTR